MRIKKREMTVLRKVYRSNFSGLKILVRRKALVLRISLDDLLIDVVGRGGAMR